MNKNRVLTLVLSGLTFGSVAQAVDNIHRDGYILRHCPRDNNRLKHEESPSCIVGDDLRTVFSTVFLGTTGALVGAGTRSAYGLALGTLLGGWLGFTFGDAAMRDNGSPAGNPWNLLKRIYAYGKHRNCNTTEACQSIV